MNNCILAIEQIINNAIKAVDSPLKGVKAVYYGDPKIIPQVNFPAITIQPKGTTYAHRGSRYDQKTHNIEIRLVYNAKSFFDKNPTKPNKVFALEDAISRVEGLVTGSKETSDNTIAGLIRKNPSLPLTTNGSTKNTAEFATTTDVVYVENVARSFPTFEVIVTINVVVVADR
ncbi:MAG: hypothetical protein V3U02_04515 [Calditrichia bacterium]